MQISSGTASVTNGSAQVVASDQNDWSDAQVALQYGTQVYFSLVGTTEIPRQVTAVATPATSLSGFWELTLVTPWDGDTAAGQSYVIHKDFTPNLGLAQPSAGDKQWAQFYSRNQEIMDAAFGQGNVTFTGLSPGAEAVIGPGKTAVSSNIMRIPLDSTLTIKEGGTLIVL
jgi:hypothetical protein